MTTITGGEGVLVSFTGGSSKAYSTIVMADGLSNEYIGEFKKRRPANFLQQYASVTIPRNEFDSDVIIDYFVHGKRLIAHPISNRELQVTFHSMIDTPYTPPLPKKVNAKQLIAQFALERSAERVSSIQSILQRVVDLPQSKSCFFSNPRYYLVKVPCYHDGKILTHSCRKRVNELNGIVASYQIEESMHLAKAIAVNNTNDAIGADFKKRISDKEEVLSKFVLKVTNETVYTKYSFGNAIKYLKLLIFHRFLGLFPQKYSRIIAYSPSK